MEDVSRDVEKIHDALRRSHSRSAIPQRVALAPTGVSEDVRARVPGPGGARARPLRKRPVRKGAVRHEEALSLDPASEDAAEVLWRAGKRIQETRVRSN
jgi:hypothetical protein